jgi:hypothetical protein
MALPAAPPGFSLQSFCSPLPNFIEGRRAKKDFRYNPMARFSVLYILSQLVIFSD